MQRPNYKGIPRFVSILMAIILMVYLASCGPSKKTYRFYKGPQLPSDETAQLVCKGRTIQINSVNAQKSPDGKDTFGNVTLEILPGDHHVTVSFSGRSSAYGLWGVLLITRYFTPTTLYIMWTLQ